MTLLVAAAFVLAAAAGTGVVLTRRPRRQALAIAVNGLALSVLFMALQAPDVAYSEIAVGTAVVPLMIMAALVSIETDEANRPDQREK